MATYPAGIYAPRTKANKPGVVYDADKTTQLFAEDVSKDDDEIVAIETELGTNPKGAYADVKARLVADESAIASKPDNFLELSDAPASYEGEAGKVVKVNDAEDGLEFGDGGGSFSSRARAYKSGSNQSIAASGYRGIYFQTESYDGLGEFSDSTFTASVAGYYLVVAQVCWDQIVANYRQQVHIYVSGASDCFVEAKDNGSISTERPISLSDIVYLAAGGTVKVYVYTEASGLNVVLGSNKTFIAVHRLS